MTATIDDAIHKDRRSGRKWIMIGLCAGGIAGVAFVLLAARLSPLLAVGAFGGLGLFLLLVRRPTLGLLLTAAVAPIERLGQVADKSGMYSLSLMRFAGMLALGALLVHAVLARRRFVFGLPFVVYTIFVGFVVLSVSYSGWMRAAVPMATMFFGNLVFLFVVINLAHDKKVADQAIAVWLLVSVLAGLNAMYDWHLGAGRVAEAVEVGQWDQAHEGGTVDHKSSVVQDGGELENLSGKDLRRSTGPTAHSMIYGINLILTVPFFLYFLRKRLSWLARVALYGGLAVILYNIFLTNTRSVLMVAALVLLLCLVRKLWALDPLRLIAGASCLVVGLVVLPADIYNRALDVSNYSPQNSATMRIRFAYWEAALELISENWLTGIGAGNMTAVPKRVRTDAPEVTNVHNDYLQMMMEVGVVQACLFFTFVALLMRYAFKAAAEYKRRPDMQEEYWFLVACQIAMIGVLVYGLQVDVFHCPLKGWWLIAGLVCVYYGHSRRLVAEVRPVGPVSMHR